MPPDFSQIGSLLFAAFVVVAIYRRFRRNFGRQQLRPGRMALRIVLLAAIGGALVPIALRSPQYLGAELAGAALGVGLGVWGAERTRFIMYGGRLHYVPHTYTGIAVSLLFLGRLTFRIVQVYLDGKGPYAADSVDPTLAFAPVSMVRSPLTVGIFFVLAAYYGWYYARVLWKSKHLDAEDIEAASPAAAQ
jgi:hypothetical protein